MSLWYNKKFSRHHMKKLKRVAEVFFFFFFFCSMWHMGSYFPDQGLNRCIGSVDHWTAREGPKMSFDHILFNPVY